MTRAIEKASVEELGKLAAEFRESSLSESTRNAYRRDFEAFQDFCETRNISSLPASSDTISAYLSYLAELRTVSTITRALTSINKAHEIAGHPPVRDQLVKATLRGIKRSRGISTGKAKGISYGEIVKMANLCEPTFIGIRDKAILLIGWASAMRRSELVSLNIEDIDFNERGVLIRVSRSKTDQEGKGTTIAIPCSESKPCPVTALHNLLMRYDAETRTPKSPVFRRIGKGGNHYWYMKNKGSRLGDRMISLVVKKYAGLAGLQSSKYSAHSLRRGLATEAGSRQIPERIIARHTRHHSIDVLRTYIEEGNVWEENPLSVIYTTRTRNFSCVLQNSSISTT